MSLDAYNGFVTADLEGKADSGYRTAVDIDGSGIVGDAHSETYGYGPVTLGGVNDGVSLAELRSALEPVLPPGFRPFTEYDGRMRYQL